jgi:ribosomal protein S27E
VLVIEQYHQLKTISRSSSVQAFYSVLSSGVHGSRNPNEALPSTLDFISDVDLCAKSVLSLADYAGFYRRYFDQYPPLDFEKSYMKPDMLRDSVGKELIEREVVPIPQYLFLHSNLQQVQCKCGDRSHRAVRSAESVWCQSCRTNLLFHPGGRTETLPKFSRYWCEECTKKEFHYGGSIAA